MVLMSAWNWFKSLFTIDFGNKKKVFDMGKLFKGLAMGGVAAINITEVVSHFGEAFRRVFDSYKKVMRYQQMLKVNRNSNQACEDVSGNTTETTLQNIYY